MGAVEIEFFFSFKYNETHHNTIYTMMSKISSVFFFMVVAVAFSVTEGTIRGTAQNDIADDPRRELWGYAGYGRAKRGQKPKPWWSRRELKKDIDEKSNPNSSLWQWLNSHF